MRAADNKRIACRSSPGRKKTMASLARVGTRPQIAEVANLAREIWEEHYVPIIGPEQVAYMLGKFQSAKAIAAQLAGGYEYYTASHQGKIEGYVAVVPDQDNGTAMLSKIYVRKSARGHGFGRAMLEFAEALCRERGIRALWLTVNKNNRSSLAWYKRLGFKNAGSIIQDIGGGFVMDDYRLEKTIGQPGQSSAAGEGLKSAPGP